MPTPIEVTSPSFDGLVVDASQPLPITWTPSSIGEIYVAAHFLVPGGYQFTTCTFDATLGSATIDAAVVSLWSQGDNGSLLIELNNSVVLSLDGFGTVTLISSGEATSATGLDGMPWGSLIVE